MPSLPHPRLRAATPAAMRSWRMGCFVFLAAFIPNLAFAEITKDEKKIFNIAQKAMEDHLDELAEMQYQVLLTQYPQSEFREEAACQMARARLNQGRWREAVETLSARLPNTSAEWQDNYVFLIGEAQLKGDLADAAFTTYSDLLSRFPRSRFAPDAKYGMARALMRQQKHDEAQEMFRTLQKEGRKDLANMATLQLGTSLFMQKKYDKAAEVLTRLAKDESKRNIGFQAVYALGEMELERKQTAAARAQFETITKSENPEAQKVAPTAFYRLAQLDAAANNIAAAAAGYEQAFRKGDEPAFRMECVDAMEKVYLKTEKVEALADKLREWSEENAKSRLGEALLLEVGTLWQRAGKRDQAILAYQGFLEKYRDGSLNDRAQFQLGWVFLDDKKYESAASCFQKAAQLARTPQLQADAWQKLGDLNFERAQFEAAASAYLKASQVKEADAAKTEQAIYQAANAFLRLGNVSEVTRLQALHAGQFPTGRLAPEFLLLLAETHRKALDMARVAEDYRLLLERFPGSAHAPKAGVDYADALYAASKLKESVDAATRFIEANPKHDLVPRALMTRARAAERLDQTEKSLVDCDAIVKNWPKSSSAPEALFWIGSYYLNKKNYAKAQEQFQLLHKMYLSHPLAPEACYFAALAAYRLGQKKDDAPHIIEGLVKEYPQSPWVFDGQFLYGDILTERGKFKDALLVFDDLTKTKSPELAERVLEAQGRRGQCLRQLGRQQDALAAFKLILDSPKADAALINQASVEMGKTYEEMGDMKQALKHYYAPLATERPAGNAPPESREFYWVCRGGLEAVGLLEKQKDWKAAAGVLKRMIERNLPCRKEAEERLKKLQSEHPDAN